MLNIWIYVLSERYFWNDSIHQKNLIKYFGWESGSWCIIKSWPLDGAAEHCVEYEQNCVKFLEYFQKMFMNGLTKCVHFRNNFCQKLIDLFILQINYVWYSNIYFYMHIIFNRVSPYISQYLVWDFCRSLLAGTN